MSISSSVRACSRPGGAQTLNAPGKFLISAPEHDTPRRARAYLLTDETVSATAALHAAFRPALDHESRAAVEAARGADPHGQGWGTDADVAILPLSALMQDGRPLPSRRSGSRCAWHPTTGPT